MSARAPDNLDINDADEADLWFLAPLPEDDLDDPLPVRAAVPCLDDWTMAEAGHAAKLARVAARLGALDERLRRGPEGWRHRLALIEAEAISWQAGDRIGAERLALWMSLRLAGVQEDTAALARAGWVVRRLTGGPGPEAGLAAFLDRRGAGGSLASEAGENAPWPREGEDRVLRDHAALGYLEAWPTAMTEAQALHPITRAAMGAALWPSAGTEADRIEAAVIAGRIAAAECGAAVFAPVAMGGVLRAYGAPDARLAAWLEAVEAGCLAAMRHLDGIEAWSARAVEVMAPLSGRTPRALREVLAEWPLVSAPMAEALTGASRAAVQRNLAWMETQGLIREVTGRGRFRMWTAAG